MISLVNYTKHLKNECPHSQSLSKIKKEEGENTPNLFMRAALPDTKIQIRYYRNKTEINILDDYKCENPQ